MAAYLLLLRDPLPFLAVVRLQAVLEIVAFVCRNDPFLLTHSLSSLLEWRSLLHGSTADTDGGSAQMAETPRYNGYIFVAPTSS